VQWLSQQDCKLTESKFHIQTATLSYAQYLVQLLFNAYPSFDFGQTFPGRNPAYDFFHFLHTIPRGSVRTLGGRQT
jgi:hypothetical protein